MLVFQSTSTNPYHNLAIEHFLLTNSDVDSRILLFYTNRPCVVIGRNQNPWTECNLQLIQEGLGGKPVDFVRRRSGGGTVFHDEGNLNFSVIVPNDKDFTRRRHSELVVDALNKLNQSSAEYEGPEDIWVNDRHDITMSAMHNKGRGEFKVSGSAFKLTRGRALHHGTLLHSSPNLDNISRLLRSPGRALIEAKGVESVRSPVMNIFNVQSVQERDKLRSQIMDEITQAFLRVYDADIPVEHVGDQDCAQEVNNSIAKGVNELMTDEWRFEQTPRFEFFGKVIDGKQLTLNAKDGYIQEARLGSKGVPVHQRSKVELQRRQKIHEIQNWRDMFSPSAVIEEQLTTIEQAFPNLQKLLCKVQGDVILENSIVEQKPEQVVRILQDGSIEKELGSNTVEQGERSGK